MATRKPKPEPTPEPSSVCKVDGCPARKTYTRGLCALHWCTRADLADPAPPRPQPAGLRRHDDPGDPGDPRVPGTRL